MTTFQVPEDAKLAKALLQVATLLERRTDFAARYLRDLAGAAQPGNGWPGPAALPWAERTKVAAAAREVAAGHPEHAERLEDFANGIDQSMAMHRANGGRY